MKTHQHIKLLALLVLTIAGSCEEFVKVDPPKTQIVSSVVFESDATVLSAAAALYSRIMDNDLFFASGPQSITFFGGLSADEFVNYSSNSTNIQYYTNSLAGSSTMSMWTSLYKTIYHANALLEGLKTSTGLSEKVKTQLTGEAMFMRALCHFYLVNLYGAVPIVQSTDYAVNNRLSRSAPSDVYNTIIKALKESQAMLPGDFSFSNNERTRPNSLAATALLARVYLYSKDWANAETQASTVINHPSFSLATDLAEVFLANSAETIWQLRPVTINSNTNDGSLFILIAQPTIVALTADLVNAFSSQDLRRTNWVGAFTTGGTTYNFPFKYKIKSGTPVREYLTVLRLGEQYLIRAEARASQGKIAEGVADLNKIRTRANLTGYMSVDQPTLLDAIEKERRLELFCEWGHRWLDLKRTDRADVILKTKKIDWQPTDTLYPVPETEIRNNANLQPQNPGY